MGRARTLHRCWRDDRSTDEGRNLTASAPAGLKDILDDDVEDGAVPRGHLPVSWLRGRLVRQATVAARCAQVGHSRSLAWLRRELTALVVRYQLEDLDGSAIRLRTPGANTQHVSRFVYQCTEEDGTAQLHGIDYRRRPRARRALRAPHRRRARLGWDGDADQP